MNQQPFTQLIHSACEYLWSIFKVPGEFLKCWGDAGRRTGLFKSSLDEVPAEVKLRL